MSSAPDTDEGLPKPRRYIAIGAVTCGTALASMDGSIANVALPTLAGDLGVDSSAVVLIVTIYQLILVMALLPLSALGNRIGHRRLYQTGQLIFIFGSILCALSNSLPFLLAARAMQAIGAAASLSVMAAMIRTIYPRAMLGRGMALNSITVASGAAIAPTLGGIILSFASWQWIFFASAPLALASLLIGRRALPDPVPRDIPYDIMAAILSAAMFGLIVAGLESLVHGDSPAFSVFIVASGLCIGGIFIRRELGQANPILPVDLLARPIFALSVGGAFAAFLAQMTILVSLPFRLQQVYGFTPTEIGAMISPWPLTSMIAAPAAGILSDRIPAGILGGIGMTIATIGMGSFAFLPPDPEYIDIAWRMVLCGLGSGLYLAPNARLIMFAAPNERAASAGGLISTNRLLGQTLGATLAAFLLARGLGMGPVPAYIAATLTAIAAITSVLRLNPAIDRDRPDHMHDMVDL